VYRQEFPFTTSRHQYYYQLAVCLGVAFVLLVTRRFDEVMAGFKPMKPLLWLGSISYSLYLMHLPFLGSQWPIDRFLRDNLGLMAADILMLGLMLAEVVLFYWLFEQPTLRRLREVRPSVQSEVVELPESG
jgi:peptidoglycan/LPS O-acetylase OafA/YrhL